MNVRHVAESILTSFLFLSRIWARSSDVVCDGGRGEGDKWFDGCRWCICERSGYLCSSSDCSPLVSRVSPCQKVDSRWWDGCYHCKCYPYGIECTANETCVELIRSKRLNPDLLSRGLCVNPADDRCVCGVDGVPSCSAEVIDRNAYPATTIGLHPVIPAASNLVSPSVVYYDGSFRNYYKRGNLIQRPEYYADSTYIHYVGEKPTKHANEQHKRRHSLVKRHVYESSRHSQDFFYNKERQARTPNYGNTVHASVLTSQIRSNSREPFTPEKRNNDGKESLGHRKIPITENVYAGRSSKTNGQDQFYHKNKWREDPDYFKYNGLQNKHPQQNDPEHGIYNPWSDVTKREIRRESRQKSMYRNILTKESAADQRRDILEEMVFSDDPLDGSSNNNASPSLLIASDNRCRWGVRWYGGSLRCFCGPDNSITCGDPSFVASRIDGFRLEKAPCEEGHVWEDDGSCRECECQVSGVALCRRSPSCPLPFLIKPMPIDGDDEGHFDRKDFYMSQKYHNSGGHTDEFTEQEIHKSDWDKTKIDSQPTSEEDYKDNKDISDNKNNLVDTDSAEKDYNIDPTGETLNTSHQILDESEETKTPVSPNDKITDLNDIIGLYFESTSNPNIVINSEENLNNENVDVSVKKDETDAKIGIDDINNELDNEDINYFDKSDFKRTTQVIVGECKPKSRWLDGCKRCECDQDGMKYCDDSRCPKTMSFPKEIINPTSDFGDKRHTRPVQRPPSNMHMARNRPVDLKPPFMMLNLCGRFTVGQKYWDECNLCICMSQGPKCTAKNCS